VASALLVASCASLTQTLAGLPTEGPKGDAGAVAVPTPAVPAPGSPAARTESVPSSDKPRVFPGTGVFLNTKPAPEFPAGGPEEASLNFEGLDVREVAKVILGDYLRESYSVHPSVTGTVTFRTIRPIPRAALMPTLEMLLRQNNATVVKEEGVFKVLPIVAVRGSVSPQLGGDSRPLPPGFSVVVVPVRYVGAREMAKILEPFAADNTVRVDEVRNLVILAGSQREMRHLLDTVALFDVDWLSGYSVGIFPVRSADVKSLVADLDKVFGPTAQGPLAGLVRVIPIERLNALLIVTTQPKYLESAKSWIERLDQIGGTAGGARLFVYAVRNGKAENLAQLLNDIFTRRTGGAIPAVSLAPGARPAQISTPAQAGGMGTPAAPAAQPAAASPGASFVVAGGTGTVQSDVRIIADKDNNALLILATPVDYEIIEAALVKLDVIPRQVLVEVTVAEVQLTDDLQFGVDWFLTPRVRSDGSITSGALNMGGLPATPTGAVPAFTGLQLINRLGGDVRGVLNALGQDGRLQVLATPQLMVLDNQKAQIKIGDRISVQTQQQTVAGTTTGLINSFQYIETGILLTVTPRINPGGQVTVEVNQEVSIPKDPFIQGNTNPDIGQRTATTTVVVASGETIVLGGLIREDNQRSTAGIPLLSKIPVLGAAFGTQQIIKRRTETILLIKPVVLTNTAQAVAATEELRRKMPSLEGFLPLRQTPPLAR
jgi:general secretion pathway protein D